jgi:hypothetical protein
MTELYGFSSAITHMHVNLPKFVLVFEKIDLKAFEIVCERENFFANVEQPF